MSSIQNLAGYKFQKLDINKINDSRLQLREIARNIGIKGSILLSAEGCNCFIAATESQNQEFLQEFYAVFPELSDIKFKVSWSEAAPFSRMLIKAKKEIITMGRPEVDAISELAPEINAEELSEKYSDYIVVDTRNDYETKLGKFKGAIDLDLKSFREFPEAIKKKLPPESVDKPIVIYCTGGIRCEKAGLWMQENGYKNVSQLKDGILGYFEKCGNANYEGECFVFDKRVGVDHKLSETKTNQCYECRTPWTEEQITERAGVCSCGHKVHWCQ